MAKQKYHLRRELTELRGVVMQLDDPRRIADPKGLVIYFEGDKAIEYFVPLELLKRDGVAEVGAEFIYRCEQDSKGGWRGRFERQPKQPTIEDHWSDFLEGLPPDPSEKIFRKSKE